MILSRARASAIIIALGLLRIPFTHAAAPSAILLPFDYDASSLCFQNADPELSQFGWLGRWGARYGICQGIAGMASALWKNAVFDPAAEAPASVAEARRLIARAVRYNKGACERRVRIPGFANTRDFCERFRHELLRDSMLYNASIAVSEILPTLPQFYTRKGAPLKCRHERVRLKRTIESLRRGLARGEPQLLMHYSHVVLAYGLRFETGVDGTITRAVFTVYNSNSTQPEEWAYGYDADGLPSMSNELIWNVTPRRLRWRCL